MTNFQVFTLSHFIFFFLQQSNFLIFLEDVKDSTSATEFLIFLFGAVNAFVAFYRRLVSSVGRVPVSCAGGGGLEPQTGPTLRVLKELSHGILSYFEHRQNCC